VRSETGPLRFGIGLCLVTGFALFLRLFHVGDISLRLDEAFSVVFSKDLSLAVKGVRPPLYYVLLGAWQWVFSDGAWSVRAFSSVIGALGVFFLGLVGRRLLGGVAGLLGALVLASFPFHVILSQQVGQYTLISTLSLISVWLLLRLVDEEDRGVEAVAFAAVNVLGVFSGYLYVFAVASQILLLVFLRRMPLLSRRDILVGLAAPFAALLLASPLVYAQVKTLKGQLAAFPELFRFWEAPFGYWISDLGWGAPWTRLHAGEDIGFFGIAGWVLSFGGVALLLVGTAAGVLKKTAGRMGLFALAYGTLVGMVLFSLVVSLWKPPTIGLVVPFFALVMALGLGELKKAAFPVAVVLAGLAGAGLVTNAARCAEPGGCWQKPAAWMDLSRDLSARYAEGDNLLIDPEWMAEALRYHVAHAGSDGTGIKGELSILGVPFNFYEPDRDLSGVLELPQAVRTWLVTASGYPAKNVVAFLEEEGYRFSHHASYWALTLDLYTKTGLAAVTGAPEEPGKGPEPTATESKDPEK